MRTQSLPILKRALTVLTATLFASCAVAPPSASMGPGNRYLDPPEQLKETVRLVIYRPNRFIGAAGRPVVYVDGQPMLNFLKESALEPGTALVVDLPLHASRIQWAAKLNQPIAAESITVEPSGGAKQFLRWTLKPTHGYLEKVDESVALSETSGLLFVGYRNLVSGARN